MSRYARLIHPMPVLDSEIPLATGTPIKCVTLKGDVYYFQARWRVPQMRSAVWRKTATTSDLPAFTDTGSAYRDRKTNTVTLRRGRPRMSNELAIKRLVCKVTAAQFSDVERRAEALELTIPEYVRRELFEKEKECHRCENCGGSHDTREC